MTERSQWISSVLTLAERDEGNLVGIRRFIQNRAAGTTHGNNRNDPPEEVLLNDMAAARAECAAKKVFDPIKWHAYKPDGWAKNLPDLGDFIDVKDTIYTPFRLRNLIGYDGKINPNWAYLLVFHEDDFFHWIVGWEWGRALLNAPMLPRARRDCHYLTPEQLRDVRELLDLVRQGTAA